MFGAAFKSAMGVVLGTAAGLAVLGAVGIAIKIVDDAIDNRNAKK